MESVFELAREDTQLQKVAVNEYAGPCPGCGGRDRFHVNLTKRNGFGGWMCRVCRPAEMQGWGDDVDYLVAFRGMSKREALKVARDQVDSLLDQIQEARTYAAPDNDEPPRAPWQEKTSKYVEDAVYHLWKTPAGRAALEYARGRGLEDSTIKVAQLGFSIDRDQAGNSIPYLVIPWRVSAKIEDGYWAVNRRDMREDKPEDAPRYKMVYGSSKQGLYGGALLERSRKFASFLVEGELDALILAQEARGYNVNVVATGGQNSILTRWAIRLSRMPLVLLAQDNEEKGNDQARTWKDVLPNAARYRPLAKDVNAMLLEGWSVRTWVEAALDMLPESIDQAPVSSAANDQVAALTVVTATAPARYIEGVVCEQCGDQVRDEEDAFVVDSEGCLFCTSCWSKREQDQDQPVNCVPCVPSVFNTENTGVGQGLQLEQPSTGDQVERQDGSAAFLDQVRAIVDGAGAWPDGYTLRLVDDSFVEQIHARALQPGQIKAYTPRSILEALPRSRCPFQHMTVSGKQQRCTGKPLTPNGWCNEHQKSALLLDMGARLGYPRVELGATAIGAGLANWEGFACYAVTAMNTALPRVKWLLDQAQRDQAAS